MHLYLGVLFNSFLIISMGEVSSQDPPNPVVQVEQGQVQGSVKYTPEGQQFYAYQGIPFGKAPTGPLRFKAPVAAEPWSGVLQVTADPPECVQPSLDIKNLVTGVEDCLQLNVYTPQLPTNTSSPALAVHVFIHGGAFFLGHINYDEINPERYMNTDMVMVAIKYRLGVLGFLSTDDEAASGNAGLLDQNLALKWVQKNIAVFGGNPNAVTLSGQSAGGASVIYHYLSPMSAGLFQRAISESGTAINPWALQDNPTYFSKSLGEHFDCTTDNTTELIDCLQQLKAEDLVGHSLYMMTKNLTLCFVPNVETSPSGQFLTEDPLAMFETGNFNRVPLQLGFNRDEGVIIYECVFCFFNKVTDTTFNVITADALKKKNSTNSVNVTYAIKDQYYATVDWKKQTEVDNATINWLSDVGFKSGICKTAALVSSFNIPTYLYAYDYVSSSSGSNFTGEPDVLHGQETQYLWYRNITDPKDVAFGKRFFQLWVDFILNGHADSGGADDPWLPTPPGQYNYYDIQERFTMRGNYDPVDMDFWWNTVPAIINA